MTIQGPRPPRPPQLPARARGQGRPHQGREGATDARPRPEASRAAAARRRAAAAAAAGSAVAGRRGSARPSPRTRSGRGTPAARRPSGGEEHAHHVEAVARAPAAPPVPGTAARPARPGPAWPRRSPRAGARSLGRCGRAPRRTRRCRRRRRPDRSRRRPGWRQLRARMRRPCALQEAAASASARRPVACRRSGHLAGHFTSGQAPGFSCLSQTAGVSRPLGGMTRKSLHMHSFLQQKRAGHRGDAADEAALAAAVAGVAGVAGLGAVAVAVLGALGVQSDVVSTVSALLTSRAGRRQMRLGHSSACAVDDGLVLPAVGGQLADPADGLVFAARRGETPPEHGDGQRAGDD